MEKQSILLKKADKTMMKMMHGKGSPEKIIRLIDEIRTQNLDGTEKPKSQLVSIRKLERHKAAWDAVRKYAFRK